MFFRFFIFKKGCWFLVCCAATVTQLATLLLHQGSITVVCSNTVAWKRPAQGHSRNGPWSRYHTHTRIDRQKRNHVALNLEHG